jgi:outer membrane protein assembly factor BamB
MRARISLAALVIACGSSKPAKRTADRSDPADSPPVASGATTPATPTGPQATAPQGEIVTAELVKMNSSEYGRPPTQFRKGHPTPRKAPAATKTATGFQVQFASHATITTPTVYERAVIVSGGFKSKELYAFDRKTGASLWALDLHDDGPSSAACERGVCVVNTESCTIFAIEAETGKHLWSYWLGDPLTSAPTIAGNRVFASYPVTKTADGKPRPPRATHALAAFDLRTGKILWQLWLRGDVMSAPVAMGDFVYVTTFNGTVIKAEQATGKIRYAMRAKATSAPVVQFDASGVEQMYYTRRGTAAEEAAGGAQEMLIRADHNEPKTRYQAAKRRADYIDKRVQSSTVHAEKAKAQDAANGFSGGAPASAASQYAADTVGVSSVSSMQNFQGSRVVKLRDRSVNTMGDEVIATDADTGAKLWSYKLAGDLKRQGGFLGTAPLAAGTSIMFGTLDGKVVRLDHASGKEVASYPVGGKIRAQPVVHDGWIYVGTEDGRLVAIDTKDPTVTGWPTWGGNAQRTGIARY